MTILIKRKKIRNLKRMFEQNQRILYIATLYVAGKIFVYYEKVRSTLLGQSMSYTAYRAKPLISTT